jgi:hypothetical protein
MNLFSMVVGEVMWQYSHILTSEAPTRSDG